MHSEDRGNLNNAIISTAIAELGVREAEKNLAFIAYFNLARSLLNTTRITDLAEKCICYMNEVLGDKSFVLYIKNNDAATFSVYREMKNGSITNISGFLPDRVLTIKSGDIIWAYTTSESGVPESAVFEYFISFVLEKKLCEFKNSDYPEPEKSGSRTMHLTLSEFIGKTSLPMILGTSSGIVVFVNAHALKILGNLQPERERVCFSEILSMLAENKNGPVNYGDKIYRIKSERIDLNGVEMISVVFEDITEYKRLDDIKTTFISGISHEIRTPLTSLISGMKLLLMGRLGYLTDIQKHFIRNAVKDAGYLLELLDNLIYVGRAASEKKPTLKLRKIRLGEFFGDLENMYLPSMKEKYIEMRINLDADSIVTDEMLLRQVFSNLISNAIKYNTDCGKIEISSRLVNDTVIIEIADTGCGIAPEEKEKIFAKFSRLDNLAHSIAGAGMGLYIVKYNLQLLGGKVELESKVGEGSVFRITLPEEIYEKKDTDC